MNRSLIMLLGSIIFTSLFPARIHAEDDQGHQLVKLWNTYQSHVQADRPEDQAAVLLQIKKEALSRKLAWDYYDACEQYIHVRSAQNWKLRDSLVRQRKKEIEDSGFQVAAFYLRRGEDPGTLLPWVRQQRKELEKSVNPVFYRNDWRISQLKFAPALIPILQNDYEYALWSLKDKQGLESLCAGDYPSDAFLAFVKAMDTVPEPAQEQALEDVAKRFSDKAAALLAEDELLRLRFNALSNTRKGRSPDFRALNDDAQDLIRRRKAFSGDEKRIADCCVQADWISESLTAKGINAHIRDGALSLSLTNIKHVNIVLKKDKSVLFETRLSNPENRFYEPDTLLLQLPEVEDGDYTVTASSGKVSQEISYRKYSLSLAMRQDAEGPGIYAADFKTGEPVGEIVAELIENQKVVSICSLRLDGFTALPRDFAAAFTSNRFRTLRVRVGTRLSRTIAHPGYREPSTADDPTLLHAVLLTDRGAFTPGETVRFKALVYRGRYTMRSEPEGLRLEALLTDASGKEIGRQTLSTSEFGTADGSFVLIRGERGGLYTLSLSAEGRTLARRSLRVDDFVLPSYDLVFDKTPQRYFPLEKSQVSGTVHSYGGRSLTAADIRYTLQENGKDCVSGTLHPDAAGRFRIEFPVSSDGGTYRWYSLLVTVTDPTGETQQFQQGFTILKRPEPEVKTEYYFTELEGDDPGVEVVAGRQTAWVVAELHGTGDKLLARSLVRLDPKGTEPARGVIRYPYLAAYPGAVQLDLLYFQNKQQYSRSVLRRRPVTAYDLPLRFSRFLDRTGPRQEYECTLETAPGVECAVSVFDVSTERLQGNPWSRILPAAWPAPGVFTKTCTGMNDSEQPIFIRGRNMARGGVMLMASAAPMAKNALMDSAAVETEESAVPDAGDSGQAEILLRENFANTLAWEPALRSDGSGTVRFRFRTADKLSTYRVQVFAHDKRMRNGTVAQELMVTLPVQISLIEPQFLYAGDRYLLRSVLSNNLSRSVPGRFELRFPGSTHAAERRALTLEAGQSLKIDTEVLVPGTDTLEVVASFVPDEGTLGSDGIRIKVPVHPAAQTLTEAHSALLPAGASRDSLIALLRSRFTLASGTDAAVRERSLLELIREALPEYIEAKSDDAVALSEALQAQALCLKIGHESRFDAAGTLERLLRCRCADGGFAWFPGMESSPVVTALVLERTQGLGLFDPEPAVRYLDRQMVRKEKRPVWWGGLSLEQYLYVRARYAQIPLEEKPGKELRKSVKSWLVPGGKRGLNGRPLAKARRIATLDELLGAEGGPALARKLGLRLAASARMHKSLQKDVASLVQYAVLHPSGGCYYPNAVLPWRGLLESELYAHSLICRLMTRFGHNDIADGIRLWLMVQKETQQWNQDPSCIEAVAAVLEGPESVLETRIVALSAQTRLPFADIKASGNGMSLRQERIERQEGRDYAPLTGPLHVGDRIRITWALHSDENRSFVRLSLPFDAGLQPVEQKSGYGRGRYRSVRADRIEAWYETFPEERILVSEEFYVVRAGGFQAPVPEIESLYAPHYRANTDAVPVRAIETGESR